MNARRKTQAASKNKFTMAGNTRDESATPQLAFGGDEGSVLQLIVASSQCPFRASDGVLLNVECFGPNYGGGSENSNASSNAGGGNSMHKRSMHNSDEWPLVSLIDVFLIVLFTSLSYPILAVVHSWGM